MSHNTDGPAQKDEKRAEVPVREDHNSSAAQVRRRTIEALSERSSPVALSDLAAAITTRENGADPPSDARSKRSPVALHHIHLPKLEDAGVVHYDPETHRIYPHWTPSLPGSGAGIEASTATGTPSDLAVEIRRTIRAYFDASTAETATLDELAGYVAAHLDDSRGRSVERIRLHHAVLPTLADGGDIEYDPRTRVVRYRGNSP